jgi:hypothetical protein
MFRQVEVMYQIHLPSLVGKDMDDMDTEWGRDDTNVDPIAHLELL